MLIGANGAGKTTLFKILTGELDYDEGQVTVAQGRRVGLISQIPKFPAGYTVEDVLRTAYHVLGQCALEPEARTALQARVDAVLAYTRRDALAQEFNQRRAYARRRGSL